MVTNQTDYRRRYAQRVSDGTLDTSPAPKTLQPAVRAKASPRLGPDGQPLSLAQQLGLAPIERASVQPPVQPLPELAPVAVETLPPAPAVIDDVQFGVQAPDLAGDNADANDTPADAPAVDPLTGTPL